MYFLQLPFATMVALILTLFPIDARAVLRPAATLDLPTPEEEEGKEAEEEGKGEDSHCNSSTLKYLQCNSLINTENMNLSQY